MEGAVLFLGLSLAMVSNWSDGRLKELWDLVSVPGQATSADHSHILALTGEVLFILLLAFIASFTHEAGVAFVALLLALWLVYITFNVDWISKMFDTLTQATTVK